MQLVFRDLTHDKPYRKKVKKKYMFLSFEARKQIFTKPFFSLPILHVFSVLNRNASLYCFLFLLPNENSLLEPHGTPALQQMQFTAFFRVQSAADRRWDLGRDPPLPLPPHTHTHPASLLGTIHRLQSR